MSKKRLGRQRQKYQDPVLEHPQTTHEIEDREIHANYLEALNSSMRRRNTAFRHKTNIYSLPSERLDGAALRAAPLIFGF